MLNEFNWDDDYSVGVYHLDEDHKTLFQLAKTIATCLKEKTCNPMEEDVFGEIIKFTKYHFKKEEELMGKTDYLETESHKVYHKNLIQQIEAYSKRISTESFSVEEATKFLVTWLIMHIQNEDKKYTNHFHFHDQF